MSLERGTTTRLSLTKFTRKFSLRNREYNKVEDLYDTRIPLHNEEAFQHGIDFKAKFIGSLEIARPTCKIDIITAMRRIRYEYKVKGIRKVRCNINVSTTGVKITKRKGKRSRKKYSEEQLFVMQHPIYRIFYVSHDSQDLKIFSYITREVPDNIFRCNVFKAYRKGLALTVVRSLGQAFDVCHKLNPKKPRKKEKEGESASAAVEAEKENKENTTAEKKEPGENKDSDSTQPSDSTSGGGGVPSSWKQFNTDLDSIMEIGGAKAGGTGEDKTVAGLSNDLMQLNFDPFSAPGTLNLNENSVNMDPFHPNMNSSMVMGAGSNPAAAPIAYPPLTVSNGAGSNPAAAPIAYPPLTVSNLSTSLPDFPDGVDPAFASSNVPPAHAAYLGRPHPRPSGTSQQQVITENMFTDPNNQTWTGNESPISIGEALDGSMHQRTTSNPFMPPSPSGKGKEKWDEEKTQVSMQMTMLKEQLDGEKAARIQSEARVEHLLMQNKELLSHLQKLMSQLSQLQSFQQQFLPGANQVTPTDVKTTPTIIPPPSSDGAVEVPLSNTSTPHTEDSTLSSSPSPLPPSTTITLQNNDEPSGEVDPASSGKEPPLNEALSPVADEMSLGIDLSMLTGPSTKDPFAPMESTRESTNQPLFS